MSTLDSTSLHVTLLPSPPLRSRQVPKEENLHAVGTEAKSLRISYNTYNSSQQSGTITSTTSLHITSHHNNKKSAKLFFCKTPTNTFDGCADNRRTFAREGITSHHNNKNLQNYFCKTPTKTLDGCADNRRTFVRPSTDYDVARDDISMGRMQ